MNDNQTIRNIIVNRREELGMSLSEMSRRLNIPKSTLSRYENLKHQYPLDEIQNFANLLGLSSKHILGLEETEEPTSFHDSIVDSILSENKLFNEVVSKLGKLNEEELKMIDNTIDSLLLLKEKRV